MKLEAFLNINTNTRMAIRAALAAWVCLLVTEHFYLDRGYWAILTALSLITPSLGASIYQSFMRFVMTIFGCFVGWGIYLLFKHQPEILLLITLVTIFIIVYTLYHDYVLRMMATGISVVMLFSFLGGWDLSLLWARIYETLLGAGIALSLNALILPEFSKNEVKKELHYLIEKIHHFATDIPKAQSLAELISLQSELNDLEQSRLNLEHSYELARFELFLRRAKRNYYDMLHTEVNLLCFYYQALLNTKISALQHPEAVRAYLAESAIDYYESRIGQGLVKLDSMNLPSLTKTRRIS
jgi:uncharacterized membrane protein YgaE (UPF0421/DUF939 family)